MPVGPSGAPLFCEFFFGAISTLSWMRHGRSVAASPTATATSPVWLWNVTSSLGGLVFLSYSKGRCRS